MKRLLALLVGLGVALTFAILSGVPAAAGGTTASHTSTGSAVLAGYSATSDEAEAEYAEGVVDIDLGENITVSGAGAAVEGRTVTITAAGVYHLSGSLSDGSLVVDAKGKVILEFDGVQIVSASGPALLVSDAKKVVITLTEGTANSLADTAGGDTDTATLLSNDTLLINGKGALTVTGNNNEAISSDDDIIVNSGTISVTAVDDGLNAHDDITINGGSLTVYAGGDALDSNGTVHVNGGTLLAFGGTTAGEGGIDAVAGLTVTGGTVVAGGNTNAPASADSKQGTVSIIAASIQEAGTPMSLVRDGEQIFAFTPQVAYQSLFITSPDLVMGAEYEAYLGSDRGTNVVATR